MANAAQSRSVLLRLRCFVAGVYISYPFCGQKCTYCNFASGVFPQALVERYVAALGAEIRRYEWRWRPETFYLGGGTPGNLDTGSLRGLLSAVPGNPWVEATIEAAPGSITAAQAGVWRDAGINRVSLGVQSFVAQELARTGRRHDARTVAREIEVLRDAGIGNFSVDLIAGLPGQTPEGWRESLDWIEKLEAPHVSVYMLEVDEDSRLGREILHSGSRYGAREAPSEEAVVEFYEAAVERFQEMGLRRYEVSNFARPGFESRHNLRYWRLEPYAGFGADAHSFDGATRSQNVESPVEYVARVERGESACEESRPAIIEEEKFFVGLRLSEGIRLNPDEWRRFEAPIRRFAEAGLVETEGETLRLTGRGILLSNEVFQEFIGI
jgi:oxygen-independent coproporphyrinogen-3 oxidase